MINPIFGMLKTSNRSPLALSFRSNPILPEYTGPRFGSGPEAPYFERLANAKTDEEYLEAKKELKKHFPNKVKKVYINEAFL